MTARVVLGRFSTTRGRKFPARWGDAKKRGFRGFFLNPEASKLMDCYEWATGCRENLGSGGPTRTRETSQPAVCR
jgi:hypothetical protein